MLFLIDSVPGGFCGSRECRYISVMLSKCPSLLLGLFPLSLIFLLLCEKGCWSRRQWRYFYCLLPWVIPLCKGFLPHLKPPEPCGSVHSDPLPTSTMHSSLAHAYFCGYFFGGFLGCGLFALFFPSMLYFPDWGAASAFVKQIEMSCAKFCIKASLHVLIWTAEVAARVVSRPKKTDLSLDSGSFPVRKT